MLLKKYYKIINEKQLFKCLLVGLMVLILGYTADIRLLQKKLQFITGRKLKTAQLLQSKNQEKIRSKIEQQKNKIIYTVKLKQWVCDFSIADILNGLEQAVIDSKVELEVLEPQPVKENEFFVMYPIRIEVNGQYKNLLGFINNVFKQPYFIVVEELILQKKTEGNGSDELNAQVLLTIFKSKIAIAKNITNESAPVNNIAIKLPERDVFTKTIGKSSLFLWASRELSFLGMVKQGQNIYGFVSDPMGAVHQVAIGDLIGLKQNRIIAIDEHGITTENRANNIYRKL